MKTFSRVPARTYVASTGYPAAHSVFVPFAERARREGWGYHELDTGHDPVVSVPEALADLLGRSVPGSFLAALKKGAGT